MSDQAAFRACFTDWRLIKGRKVVQIVLEVPLEHSDHAYQALGGMPDPGKSVWCAVARLVSGDVAPEREGAHPAPHTEAPSRASPKSYAQQAGILCEDPLFQKFCNNRDGLGFNHVEAATAVRDFCEITSRSQLLAGTTAGARWLDLVARFKAWKLAA